MIIKPSDLAFLEKARQSGVLIDVQGHQLDSKKGTIIVGCADGDRFGDLYSHHCGFCESKRHHPLSLNGGALLISPYSQIPGARTDGEVLIRHIKSAASMKGIEVIALYVHAPCGAAYAAGLEAPEVMRLLLEAKLFLKQVVPEEKFACFLHIDYDHKKRTYFVHRMKALEFLKAEGLEVRT